MAHGRKTGGRDWGVNNPPPKSPGAPKISEEVKQVRKLSNELLTKCWEKYFVNTSFSDLEILIKKVKEGKIDLPVMDAMFIRFIQRAQQKGEYILIKDLFDRILGKPKTYIEADLTDKRTYKNIDDVKAEIQKVERMLEDARK